MAWWVVANEKEDDRDDVRDKVQVIVPAPSESRVCGKSASDKRTESRERACGEEEETGEYGTMFVGYDFHEDEATGP